MGEGMVAIATKIDIRLRYPDVRQEVTSPLSFERMRYLGNFYAVMFFCQTLISTAKNIVNEFTSLHELVDSNLCYLIYIASPISILFLTLICLKSSPVSPVNPKISHKLSKNFWILPNFFRK